MKHAFSNLIASSRTVRIGFFFNARGNPEERSATGLYKSLLHQLLRGPSTIKLRLLRNLRRKKMDLRRRPGMSKVDWTLTELRELLHDVFVNSTRVPIEVFVDALDECDREEVRSIVQTFANWASEAMHRGSILNMCWASRHYPHISVKHSFELWVENMNFEDIATYVTRRLDPVKSQARLGDVEAQIVAKSNGVFLWSVLVVSKVCKLADKGFPLARIKKVIGDLPSELDELYKSIFSDLDPTLAEDTVGLVCLVLFALRPFNTDEIRIALEFMRSDYPRTLQQFASLPEQVSYFRLFVTEISGGLFEVVNTGIPTGPRREDITKHWAAQKRVKIEETGIVLYKNKSIRSWGTIGIDSKETKWIVQVIHESVRDFLLEGGATLLLQESNLIPLHTFGHLKLYEACARILNTEEMRSVAPADTPIHVLRDLFLGGFRPNLIELGRAWLGTSLLEYVMESTFKHFNLGRAVLGIQPQANFQDHATDLGLLDAANHWLSINRVHGIPSDHLKMAMRSAKLVDQLTKAESCAQNGHFYLCTLYASSERNKVYPKQLIVALAHHGLREELVDLITRHKPRARDSYVDRNGHSPIWAAIDGGHDSILGLLLEKGFYTRKLVNPKTTPLHFAIRERRVNAVRQLLLFGIDDDVVQSALQVAKSVGEPDIVELLKKHGAYDDGITRFPVLDYGSDEYEVYDLS